MLSSHRCGNDEAWDASGFFASPSSLCHAILKRMADSIAEMTTHPLKIAQIRSLPTQKNDAIVANNSTGQELIAKRAQRARAFRVLI